MKKIKKTNITIITVAIFLTTFMTAIEGTIVSTAMPTIVSDLNGLEYMSWVVSIFLLMTAVSTPIYGKLADKVGRKPIMLFGLLIFLIGSSLCGVAQNMFQLIIFRVIQGLGSGAIQPVAITMIADMYAIDKRAKMLGINSGFWGVASVIAPLLGGFIVQHLSWHWVFYINIPFGILAMILIQIWFIESKKSSKTTLDYKGTTTLVIVLLSLMLFLQGLGDKLNVFVLILLFLISIFGSFFFVKIEKKAQDPILPLNMFKNREFVCQNLITLLISGVIIGFEFYLPTWMQGINGTTVTLAGFAVTPSSLMWIIGSFASGTLIAKFSVKRTFDGFLTLLLITDLILLFIPQSTSFWVFCAIAALNGLGFGIIITIGTVRSQVLVPSNKIGIATSVNTLVKYLGQTMMISIFGIAFNLTISNNLKKYPALNHEMMNKIVSSEKTKLLNPALVPDLRNILFSALHSIYWVSFVLLIFSIIINQFYRDKKVK